MRRTVDCGNDSSGGIVFSREESVMRVGAIVVGFTDGALVLGDMVGLTLRAAPRAIATLVGSTVGTLVGVTLGLTVGVILVGFDDGAALLGDLIIDTGWAVGSMDTNAGIKLGDEVMRSIGESVGSSVGVSSFTGD